MTDTTTTPALVHLDPTTLTPHPANVRADLGDLDELTASIRQVGILEPLVVVPTDHGHRIVAGHRRHAAAIAAKVDRVPCYERADLAGDADQVLAMLVENLRRADLTDAEEARGYQQLLDLGLSATKIAKAAGTSRDRVRQALAVTKSDTAVAAAAQHSLTLDQALVLAEFADDEDAIATLTATAIDDPYDLEHVASRIRQDRERHAEFERLMNEHQAARITIVDHRPDSDTNSLKVPRPLDYLTDADDQVLDADNHNTCPGHAVWIASPDYYRTDVVYACSDPQAHGHRNRYGTDGENKLPEQTKAERRDVIENNKAWRAAEPVRREYLRTLLTSTKVPKCTLRFVTTEIMANPTSFGHGPDELIADLAHITKPASIDTTPSWHRTAGPALAAKASDARLPLVLLAQLAAAREQTMDVHTWRKPSPTSEARWLTYLADTGYTLADIEQRVIDTANTLDDEAEPAEPDTDNPSHDDTVATGHTSDAA